MLSRGARLTSWSRSDRREGFTLAEVVLTLVLAGLVLGVVTATGVRLQRQLASEGTRLARGDQMAAAAAVLPPDLRALSIAGGDIRPGEARDTSLEIRATIGSAVVCGGDAKSLIIAPYLGPFAKSSNLGLQSGDTLWVLADMDSGESWHPARLQALRRLSGRCGAVADAASRDAFDGAHLLSAELRDSLAPSAGSVVRATRPLRYSLYRAGDGAWYLGARSWNSGTSQFNLTQPISGPYASPASGSRFTYYDSVGTPLASGTSGTARVARIEVVVVAAGPIDTRDSLLLVVASRNRK